MNAKELSQIYLSNPCPDSEASMIIELCNEVQILVKQRNAKKDSALISILRELNQKYTSTIKKIHDEGYELNNIFIMCWILLHPKKEDQEYLMRVLSPYFKITRVSDF